MCVFVCTNHQSENDACKLMQIQSSQGNFWLTSDTIPLNIAFKPRVSIGIKHQQQQEQHNSTPVVRVLENNAPIRLYASEAHSFVCLFEANPSEATRIVWKLDGRVVDQQQQHELTLEPPLASSAASGSNLTCEVANTVGTGSFAYTIVWLRAPKLSVSGPRVHHVDEFNALRLVCSVDAAAWPPVDSVEWRKYSSPDSLSEYQVLSKEWTLDLK